MLTSQERSPTTTRRRFCQLGLAALTASTVSGLTVDSARAQTSTWPIRSDENWWPFTKQGKLRIFDLEGPLDRFDKDKGSNLREEFEAFAMWALKQVPEALKASQGLCNAAAVTNLILARGIASGEFSEDKVAAVYNDPNKKGLLDALSTTLVFYRPTGDIQSNRHFFLNNLIDTNTAFIADLNDGKIGEWYRVVQSFDPSTNMVLAHGFGESRWLRAENIGKTCFPETVSEAKSKGRDPRLINENQGLRFAALNQEDIYIATGLR